jgi:cell division protein FtsL
MNMGLQKLNFLLLAVLIFCGMSVVTSQHRARKSFIELQNQQDAEKRLDQEWRELQLEAQTQGMGKRVEKKAVTELGMVQPDGKKTLMVVLAADGTATINSAAELKGAK